MPPRAARPPCLIWTHPPATPTARGGGGHGGNVLNGGGHAGGMRRTSFSASAVTPGAVRLPEMEPSAYPRSRRLQLELEQTDLHFQ